MSLTRIGSIGINTGIAFAGVTTIVTLNTANDALSIGATVNIGSGNLTVGSGVTVSSDGDGFFTGVITATSYSGIDLSDVTGATGDFSIADKIVHTGDTDTAIRFSAADTVSVETGGTQKLSLGSATVFNETGADVDFRIESSGTANMFLLDAGNNRIGLNRPTPIEMFEVGGNIFLSSNTSNANEGNALKFQSKTGGFDTSYGAAIHGLRVGDASSYLRFDTGGQSEKMRLDSSGRLLLGTDTSRAAGGNTHKLFQIEATDATSGISITRNSDTATASIVSFCKSRGTSNGSSTIVQDGDELGRIKFSGADGNDLLTESARIRASVDGTPGGDDMPGRLQFYTTADGAASPTERLRITSDGRVLIGTTSSLSFNGAGGNHNLVVAGDSNDTDITDNHNAAITISNKDGTANNTAGLHFAREDTDGNPHYDGASVVAQFKETMNTGQYPKADLVFLTSSTNNAAPSEKFRIDSNGHARFGLSGDASDSAWSHGTYGNTEVAIDGGGGYGVLHLRGDGAGSTNTRFTMGCGDDKFYMAYDDVDGRHNMVVSGDGVVSIPVGIELGSGTDATAANILDDYEEGTHNGTDASGSGLSFTYLNSGRYTKIGRFVIVSFDVVFPTTGSGGLAAFSPPFTNALNYGAGVVGWTDLGRPVQIHVGTTNVYIMDNNSTSGNQKHLTNAECSGKRFIGNYTLQLNE